MFKVQSLRPNITEYKACLVQKSSSQMKAKEAGSKEMCKSAKKRGRRVHFAENPHHQARVLLRQEVPVYQIDDGAHGRTCMRKVLITLIIILSILILLVIILRSIF